MGFMVMQFSRTFLSCNLCVFIFLYILHWTDFLSKLTKNFLNNRRYHGLDPKAIATIRAKEVEVTKAKMYPVITYMHLEDVKALVKLDKEEGIQATKYKRAAAKLYTGMTEAEQKKILDTLKEWEEHGPPSIIKYR